MDNLIPPINNPQISPAPTDKPLGGTIETISSSLLENSLKPGQSAMLEVLADSKNNITETLVGKIQITVKNQLLNIPVEIKLDTPLKLPSETAVNQLNIRMSPQPDGTLAVKIVTVNNENPEKFAVRGFENAVRPQAANTALINDTGTKLPQVEAAPLKTTVILEKLAAETKLPLSQAQVLIKEFADISAPVAVLPHPAALPRNMALITQFQSEASGTLQPPKTTLEMPLPLTEAMRNIKVVMTDFSSGKMTLSEAVSQIKNEFAAVKNLSIPAEILSRPDNGITVVRTPLTEILIENPVKIGSGLPVLLQVDEFVQKLGNKLVPLRSEHLSTAAQADLPALKAPPVENLLKILAPLFDKGQQNLAAAILNKIPEPSSPRMLANMVAYIKAAGEHNLSRWLGSDIIDKLGATTEGRETAAKLGSMFVASHQDGINWRIMEIPILNGDTLSKIRIAVKKILDEEEKKKNKENRRYGTRFVVDTAFTRLGSFQFDGYSFVKDRRFDLIIRTEREIDSDFCANIMRLFKNTLLEEGYVGNVKINVKEKFIKICDNQTDTEILADGIYV